MSSSIDIIELKRNIKDTLAKSNVLDIVNNDIDHNADFSLKHLKSNLKDTLKKSGVLNTVKAQIRQEFIKGLANIEKENVYQTTTLTLNDRILLSCIYHFLYNRKLVKTISVLIAECGLDPKYSILTENDLSKMIKFNNISNTYDSLKSSNPIAYKSNELLLPDEIIKQNKTSILDLLVYSCFTINDLKKEISCQTEFTGPSIREFLDDEIQNIHHKYRVNRDKELLQPNKTIEERMIAFQRDCEKRMLQDLTIQVNHIRENEINRVRLEEIQKSRIALETMRKEIDHEYNRRLQAHIDRENASALRLSEQEQQTQRSLYETRQLMQREADEWRSRESAAIRKQELESQGIRMMELRLHEAQAMIEIRERSISQREKELDEKNKLSRDYARKEALATVQSELDILSKEKSTLMLERKRFEDERTSQSVLVESTKSIRERLNKALDELQQKDDEIISINRKHQRMIKYQEDEETVRKDNKDLESNYRELQMKFEYEKKSLLMEQDKLQNNLSIEKSRTASYKHKLEELSYLINDKSKTIESLQKQLTSQKNNDNVVNGSRSGSVRSNLHLMIDKTIHKNRINSNSTRNKHIDELLIKYNDQSIYNLSNLNTIPQYPNQSTIHQHHHHRDQETKANNPSYNNEEFDNVIERISQHTIQSLVPSSSPSFQDTAVIHNINNSTHSYHPSIKNIPLQEYPKSTMMIDNDINQYKTKKERDNLVDMNIELTNEYIQNKKGYDIQEHERNTNKDINKYIAEEIEIKPMKQSNTIPISVTSSTDNIAKMIDDNETFARDSLEQVILKYSDTSNLEPLITSQTPSMFVTSIDSTIYKGILPSKQITLNNDVPINRKKVDLVKDEYADYTSSFNKQSNFYQKSKECDFLQLDDDLKMENRKDLEQPTTKFEIDLQLRRQQQKDEEELRIKQQQNDKDELRLKQQQDDEEERRSKQQQDDDEELRLKQQQDDDEELRLKQQQDEEELRLKQQQDDEEERRSKQQQDDEELRSKQQQDEEELRLKQQQNDEEELRLKQQQNDEEELRLKQHQNDEEELRLKQQHQDDHDEELRLKQQQDEEDKLRLKEKQQDDEELRFKKQQDDEEELRLKQHQDDDNEDEGDFLDFAAIRRNALARRKNSLLSQSLPSVSASFPVSLSDDVSTVGTGEITRQSNDITNTLNGMNPGVSSSIDNSLAIKRNIGKDFFKTLQDDTSDSDISETKIETADQSDDISDNWG